MQKGSKADKGMVMNGFFGVKPNPRHQKPFRDFLFPKGRV